MNRKKKRYILPLHLYRRYHGRYGKVECHKCERPLEVGDDVFSRGNGKVSTYKTVLYCIPCARDLYFVED